MENIDKTLSQLQAQPLKFQIPIRFGLGLLVATINTIGLISTSALFSLPIIVPTVAGIAALVFTMGFFPEIGMKIGLPTIIVGSFINLSQLGVAFATKTTLFFTLTHFGINCISIIALGLILNGAYSLLECCL